MRLLFYAGFAWEKPEKRCENMKIDDAFFREIRYNKLV